MKFKLFTFIATGLLLGIFFASCKKKASSSASSAAANSCAAATVSAIGSIPSAQLALSDLTLPSNALGLASQSNSNTTAASQISVDYTALGNLNLTSTDSTVNTGADLSPSFLMWKACSQDGSNCTTGQSYNFSIGYIPNLPQGFLNITAQLCVANLQFLNSADQSNAVNSCPKATSQTPISPCYCGKFTSTQWLNLDNASQTNSQFASDLTAYQTAQNKLLTTAQNYVTLSQTYVNQCADDDMKSQPAMVQWAKNVAALSSTEIAAYVESYAPLYAQIMSGVTAQGGLGLASATSTSCPVPLSSTNTSLGNLSTSTAFAMGSLMGMATGTSTTLASSPVSTSPATTAVAPLVSTSPATTNEGAQAFLGVGIPTIFLGVAMIAGFGGALIDEQNNWKGAEWVRKVLRQSDYLAKKIDGSQSDMKIQLQSSQGDAHLKYWEAYNEYFKAETDRLAVMNTTKMNLNTEISNQNQRFQQLYATFTSYFSSTLSTEDLNKYHFLDANKKAALGFNPNSAAVQSNPKVQAAQAVKNQMLDNVQKATSFYKKEYQNYNDTLVLHTISDENVQNLSQLFNQQELASAPSSSPNRVNLLKEASDNFSAAATKLNLSRIDAISLVTNRRALFEIEESLEFEKTKLNSAQINLQAAQNEYISNALREAIANLANLSNQAYSKLTPQQKAQVDGFTKQINDAKVSIANNQSELQNLENKFNEETGRVQNLRNTIPVRNPANPSDLNLYSPTDTAFQHPFTKEQLLTIAEGISREEDARVKNLATLLQAANTPTNQPVQTNSKTKGFTSQAANIKGMIGGAVVAIVGGVITAIGASSMASTGLAGATTVQCGNYGGVISSMESQLNTQAAQVQSALSAIQTYQLNNK